jgi:hypothetical protein
MKADTLVWTISGLDPRPRVGVDRATWRHVCSDIGNRVAHTPAATADIHAHGLVQIRRAFGVDGDEWNLGEVDPFALDVSWLLVATPLREFGQDGRGAFLVNALVRPDLGEAARESGKGGASD